MEILLTEGLSRFAFRRLSEKQKNQKLCALCGSAVNNFLIKTLFRVVVDLFLEFPRQDTNFKPPLSESRGMRFQRDQLYLKLIKHLNFRHFSSL